MRPLNIWIINHYAGNLKHGMEYRHFFLARHLKKLGNQVGIISSSFHHLFTALPKTDGAATFEEIDDIPFCWLQAPHYQGNGFRRLFNMITFSLRLNRYHETIRDEFGVPDIILGSSPHPFVAWNLFYLKKVFNVPVIFEVRDLWPLMLNELGSLSKYNPLSTLFAEIEKKAFRECDRVISLWHSADKYMFENGLHPDRYSYLPNGIELKADGSVEEVDSTHSLIDTVKERKAAGKFIIGYGGSHGLANPLSCIIDTCVLLRERKINDVEFFLVGDGPIKEEIFTRAKSLGLENIHFHDYVSKAVIMGFYDQIDIAFMGLRDLPLFKYGPTPNKLMDYLAMAKPIIYAINSSFNPIKEIGAGESIPADNPEKFVEAILNLKSKSTQELAEMGERGREYAKKELDFKALAAKLSEIANDCINKKSDAIKTN